MNNEISLQLVTSFRPLRFLLLCLFLLNLRFLTPGYGQSLFQETVELQALLEQLTVPTIKGLDKNKWTISFNDETLSKEDSIFVGTDIHLHRVGRYDFKPKGPENTADFTITYGIGVYLDTAVVEQSQEFRIYNLPDAVKWYSPSLSNGSLIKKDYYRIISLLGLHSAYQEESFSFNTLERIYTAYKDNPFLSKQLQNLFYDYELNDVALYMTFDQKRFSDSITSNLDRNYQWLNRLYREPVLDFKKQVLEEKDEAYYQNLELNDNDSQQKLTIAAESANAEYDKVGGINSTAIIEGLSDFIVERAQEELNEAFMDRFKRRMIETTPNEYSILFPRTYDLFLQFEISNYNKLLQSARPSFLQDLQQVGLNLPKILYLDKYEGLLDYSPSIYNLALFYNLSQLIFTDHTIEDIMPFAYQHLAKRHLDLSEFVNLSIGSSIEDRSKIAGFTAARSKLQNEIGLYCKEAQSTYSLLEKSYLNLINEIEDLKDTTGDFAPEISTALDGLKNELQFSWAPLGDLEYDIPGRPSQKVFDYYPKYALTNLEGKGYFGDQIKEIDPKFKNYKAYFSDSLSARAYVARGLELSRLLLKEKFNEKFEQEEAVMSTILSEARELKKQVLLLKKKELGNKVKTIVQLRDTLTAGLDTEIDFWKSQQVADTTNIDLAALVYLQRLLKNSGQETWAKINILNRMMRRGGPLSPDIIQRNDPSLTPNKVRFHLKEADRQLNDFHQEALKRIQRLSSSRPTLKHQPNAKINDFLATQKRLNAIDISQFKSLDDIKENLAGCRTSRKTLRRHYSNVKHQLGVLDTTYCQPTLSRSRDNAQDLAGVVELATHLLFSFKRGEKSVNTTNTAGLLRTNKELQWLDKDTYNELMGDPQSRSIYLGLLYQQLNSLKGTPTFTQEGLATISTKLINTIFEIKSGRDSIQFKRTEGDKLGFPDYYPLLKSTVDLVTTVVETPVFNGVALRDKLPALGSITKVGNEGLALYQNINTKQYGFAIHNAMELYRVMSDAQIAREQERKNRFLEGMSSEDRKELRKLKTKTERIQSNVIKYGNFMADVVSATNSDQVKHALTTAAAKKGSSSLKRNHDVSLGINSYLGFALGRETLLNPEDNSQVDATTVGLTVPVGLALSWKFNTTHLSSYTLFLSVLDIGAVTSYRLNDPMASSLPKLDFENFLAPGASLFYNFNRVPISMGLGWQLGPQTRKIDPSNPDLTSQASRFIFSINVDVPLFNFATGRESISSKRRKISKKKSQEKRDKPGMKKG